MFLLPFFLVMQRNKVFGFAYVSVINIFLIILIFFMILYHFNWSIRLFLNSERVFLWVLIIFSEWQQSTDSL